MNQQVNRWIDSHRKEIVESLCSLLRFPSVKSEPFTKAMPFGKGIAQSLDFMLELGSEHGYPAVNLDGYVGYVDLEGRAGNDGDVSLETVGILTHLDVVPAGEGWTVPPFGGTINSDKIYGRGAMDDKGAVIASFFAMLALDECKVPLKRNIRLIMGCDEESGLTCIDRYCRTEKIPEMSFSPDGDYPLVNSEKNIYHAYYESAFHSEITIHCGERVNIVPLIASAVVPFTTEEIQQKVDLPMKESAYEYTLTPLGHDQNSLGISGSVCRTKIDVHGKASHSSHPENGKNALQGLIYLLTFLPLQEEDRRRIQLLYDMFGLEYDGKLLGLDKEDESGKLTINLGVMEWTTDGLEMQIDVRAPLSVTRGDIESVFVEKFKAADIRCGSKTKFVEGLYVPEDSELVTKLLQAYREYTGDNRPPIKIGGGTYARRLPNAVAFGIEFPDKECVMHMPDEYIEIEDLILDTKILAHAMLKLAGE